MICSSKNRRKTGSYYEQEAKRLLLSKWDHLLGENIYLGHNEIDLIFVDKGTLIFVEVRTRHTHAFSLDLQLILPYQKRKSLRLGISRYLKKNYKKIGELGIFETRLDLLYRKPSGEWLHFERIQI